MDDHRVAKRDVLFEGFSEQQILDLPKEAIEQLVFLGEPLIFKAGSALILGSFKVESGRLVLELALIEGGSEGVLPWLASVAISSFAGCWSVAVL